MGEEWSVVALAGGMMNLSHTFHLTKKLNTSTNENSPYALNSISYDHHTRSIIFADSMYQITVTQMYSCRHVNLYTCCCWLRVFVT